MCIFILKDADPGAPDANLDQQRNRITAAAALKQAKVLADSGMCFQLIAPICTRYKKHSL